MQKVSKSDLGEVVILDADNNIIESPFQDLESLPLDVVRKEQYILRHDTLLQIDNKVIHIHFK